jgi:hypothetical protein
MFTASGLRVRFLKVSTYMETFLFEFSFLSRKCDLCHCRCEITSHPKQFFAYCCVVIFEQVWEKSGYNTVEWVRYITKAGSYEIRC